MNPSAYVTKRELHETMRRNAAWAGLAYVVFVVIAIAVGLLLTDRSQDADTENRIATGIARSCEIRFLLADLIARNTATLAQATSGGIDPLSQERTVYIMRSTNRAREILLGVPVSAAACRAVLD